MSIKINFKDIPAVTSAQGSDRVMLAWGANGDPKLIRIDQLGVAPIAGASGVLLTCVENGYTYQLGVAVVDGAPVYKLTKVSGQGQFTSVLCEDNSTTYQLTIKLINGQPTLTTTAL